MTSEQDSIRIYSGIISDNLKVDFVIAGVSRGSKMVCLVCIILKSRLFSPIHCC